MQPTQKELFEILDRVKDPEIPVISVVELGVVRDIVADDDGIVVNITPTYSGCPALHVMEQDIRDALKEAGHSKVDVNIVYKPAWTTDWISDEAKQKLREYGIAPPGSVAEGPLVNIGGVAKVIDCPYCGNSDTKLQSEFGSTSCKSLHFCNHCTQPFEHFKAL